MKGPTLQVERQVGQLVREIRRVEEADAVHDVRDAGSAQCFAAARDRVAAQEQQPRRDLAALLFE